MIRDTHSTSSPLLTLTSPIACRAHVLPLSFLRAVWWRRTHKGFCPGIMWILENVELSPWPSTSCTPHSLAASCLSGGKDEAVGFSVVLVTAGNHVCWTAGFQPELVDWADQLMAFAVSILLWSNCHQSSLAFIPPASKKNLPADGLHSIQMLSAKHWKVLRPVAQTKPVNREPTDKFDEAQIMVMIIWESLLWLTHSFAKSLCWLDYWLQTF